MAAAVDEPAPGDRSVRAHRAPSLRHRRQGQRTTAYLGVLDTELKLERAGEGAIRLEVKKQRNAPDGTKVTMRLELFARERRPRARRPGEGGGLMG